MFAIKECLLIEPGIEGSRHTQATITLDDGTVIEVQQVNGADPSPFLFVTSITAAGFSAKALNAFTSNPKHHENFHRVWGYYLEGIDEQAGDQRRFITTPVPADVEAAIKQQLDEGSIALRLEGRKPDLVAMGEEVSVHIVFFGFGHTTLGTVVGIDVH